MLKISDLKKSIAELNKEQFLFQKEKSKIIKQKEKIINNNVKKIFLESIQELTWKVEFADSRVYFFHGMDWIQNVRKNSLKYKVNNYSLLKSKKQSKITPLTKAQASSVKYQNKQESIYNKKFGKLYRFLENSFDGTQLKICNLPVCLIHDGFFISIIIENNSDLNKISSFVEKTKIKLNLESFNQETEALEEDLKMRKHFLQENSNAFLFGL